MLEMIKGSNTTEKKPQKMSWPVLVSSALFYQRPNSSVCFQKVIL